MINKNIKIKNNLLYQVSSLVLYFLLYILITSRFKGMYNPIIGAFIFTAAILIDFFFAKLSLRVFIRFLIILIFYFILKYLVLLFSILASNPESYHIIIDKLPFLYNRDTIIAVLFIIFYFIFDSLRTVKRNTISYIISTIILIAAFFYCLHFKDSISKTFFKNYLILFGFSIIIISFLILRHIFFHLNSTGKSINRKDFLLFLPLILILCIVLWFFILPEHIEKQESLKSGLFSQSPFHFDFSNFIELKDEIKLNDDRVMILELSGVKTGIKKRIHKGWNRQIYLKRFALEEYMGNGKFKMTDKYHDPVSPPRYLSGYKWEIQDKPDYKNRLDIIQTLYLINIDPTSLMGSDMITKVVPVTNWPDSPFKQIYKSYSYTSDIDIFYSNLFEEDLDQNKFLANLHPERKKLLLNWGDEKNEGKIKELADNLTKYYDDPFRKTIVIQEYLRHNYYYSLKPGLAINSDQLNYFLFESKKGYCSYFAFAMVMMLRSQGIPSRIAVGFAPDMENRTLNFYDVRSLHAHAWVEVFFDDFGWITFDPTSSEFAPGENYDFFFGDKEERNDLIEEIIKNKDNMEDINKEKENSGILDNIVLTIKQSIRWIGVVGFIFILISIMVIIYLRKNFNYLLFIFESKSRNKIRYLYKDMLGKLLDLGFPITKNEAVQEYADRLKNQKIVNIIELTKLYQAAIFKEKNYMEIAIPEINNLRKQIINELKTNIKLSKRIKAFFNISRFWRKILPMIIILLFSMLPLYSQQDSKKTLSDYIDDANNFIAEGYYDKALELLNEAEKEYPEKHLPNLEKGKLFYYYDLYENAIIELEKAKEKSFNNNYSVSEEIYQYIANSYGSIGNYKKAVSTYEEALDTKGESLNLYDKLSWMYYKTNEYQKGIDILLKGLKKYENSSDLLMTLGTLYSSIYDYEKSKKCYLESIDYSYEDFKSDYFRSICFYNLSLLEKSFYYYDESFNTAKASISFDDRGSPHLQLNYLYQGAMEFKKAYKEITKASRLKPSTHLPQLSLIYVYIYSGKLEDAIGLSRKLLKEKDFSWMLYFGMNREEYYAELYRNLSVAYELRISQVNFNDKKELIHALIKPIKKIYYYILSKYYNYKYANLYIKIGEEKIKGGGIQEGYSKLITAYEKLWTPKALKLLKLSEKIEVPGNPGKKRIYDINKAILKEKSNIFYTKKYKREVLLNVLPQLDEHWEKDIIADILLEIIKSLKWKQRDYYIERLFFLHAPYLAMNNIKTKIKFSYANINSREYKKLKKALKKRGMIHDPDSRIMVEIIKNSSDNYNAFLYDNNVLLKTWNIDIQNTERIYNDISLNIFNKLFIIELE